MKKQKKNQIKKCYFCGKVLKEDKKIRITEDPNDSGFWVSICEECEEDLKKDV